MHNVVNVYRPIYWVCQSCVYRYSTLVVFLKVTPLVADPSIHFGTKLWPLNLPMSKITYLQSCTFLIYIEDTVEETSWSRNNYLQQRSECGEYRLQLPGLPTFINCWSKHNHQGGCSKNCSQHKFQKTNKRLKKRKHIWPWFVVNGSGNIQRAMETNCVDASPGPLVATVWSSRRWY